MKQDVVRMEAITKVYSNGVRANHKVNFSVRAGEIHALMGENGAGKSTLMKILYGECQPEEGQIYLYDQPVKLSSPQDAIAHGIGMVHQHFMLVPSLTVAENVFLGMEPKKHFLIDTASVEQKTEELAKKYNFNIPIKAKVADIPVGVKQKVEILKALARGAKILILDEPTAVLTPQETEELFAQLLKFKEEGHTIIFISHKLGEIKQICDRITIMKSGEGVGTFELEGMDEADISRLMVGRDVVQKIDKKAAAPGRPILVAENLKCVNDEGTPTLRDVSLSVRSGEILGIAGVEGNGQLELVETITGNSKLTSGTISIDGVRTEKLSVKKIRQAGMAHIPEDRIAQGSAGVASIEENLVADKMFDPSITSGPFLKSDKIAKRAEELVEEFQIVCSSPKQLVGMLSGGNMQKVVVARELSGKPKLVIANQPSRGVDVGATEFIHKKLLELRDEGAAVLLVSADLNEVMSLSDSLAVFYGGEVAAYFEDSKEVTEEELGLYMLGLKHQDKDDVKRRVLHEKAE